MGGRRAHVRAVVTEKDGMAATGEGWAPLGTERDETEERPPTPRLPSSRAMSAGREAGRQTRVAGKRSVERERERHCFREVHAGLQSGTRTSVGLPPAHLPEKAKPGTIRARPGHRDPGRGKKSQGGRKIRGKKGGRGFELRVKRRHVVEAIHPRGCFGASDWTSATRDHQTTTDKPDRSPSLFRTPNGPITSPRRTTLSLAKPRLRGKNLEDSVDRTV